MKIHFWLSIFVLTLSSFVIDVAIAGLFERPDFFERGREEFEEEIRRFEQGNAVPDPALTIDEEALPWSRVIIDSAGFTAMIPPGALTNEVETVEIPQGNIEFDIIASHPSSSRYVIAYSEEVKPGRFANGKEILARSRDYIIENNIDLIKVAEDDITVENYSAKEFKLQNETEIIVFRLILAEQRLYVLAVSQDSKAISEESIDTFFDSFKLINK